MQTLAAHTYQQMRSTPGRYFANEDEMLDWMNCPAYQSGGRFHQSGIEKEIEQQLGTNYMSAPIKAMYRKLYWSQIFSIKTTFGVKVVAIRSLWILRKMRK